VTRKRGTSDDEENLIPSVEDRYTSLLDDFSTFLRNDDDIERDTFHDNNTIVDDFDRPQQQKKKKTVDRPPEEEEEEQQNDEKVSKKKKKSKSKKDKSRLKRKRDDETEEEEQQNDEKVSKKKKKKKKDRSRQKRKRDDETEEEDEKVAKKRKLREKIAVMVQNGDLESTRECKICKDVKEIADFHKSGIWRWVCYRCALNQNAERRRNKRQQKVCVHAFYLPFQLTTNI
jgi:hypothetical protein